MAINGWSLQDLEHYYQSPNRPQVSGYYPGGVPTYYQATPPQQTPQAAPTGGVIPAALGTGLAKGVSSVLGGGEAAAAPEIFGSFAGPEAASTAAATGSAPMLGVGAGPLAGIAAATYLGGKSLKNLLQRKKDKGLSGLAGRATLGIATGGLSEVARGLMGRGRSEDQIQRMGLRDKLKELGIADASGKIGTFNTEAGTKDEFNIDMNDKRSGQTIGQVQALANILAGGKRTDKGALNMSGYLTNSILKGGANAKDLYTKAGLTDMNTVNSKIQDLINEGNLSQQEAIAYQKGAQQVLAGGQQQQTQRREESKPKPKKKSIAASRPWGSIAF